jgi:hypothetical protein
MKKTVTPVVGQVVRANWLTTHLDPVLQSSTDLRLCCESYSILITLLSADGGGAKLQIEAPSFVELESPEEC